MQKFLKALRLLLVNALSARLGRGGRQQTPAILAQSVKVSLNLPKAQQILLLVRRVEMRKSSKTASALKIAALAVHQWGGFVKNVQKELSATVKVVLLRHAVNVVGIKLQKKIIQPVPTIAAPEALRQKCPLASL